MKFTSTELEGAYLIGLDKFEDERGFFARGWCHKEFSDHGLRPWILQSNISYNLKKGTLRGMHYQRPPFQETKLVRCVRGAIYDVIIDLRPYSPTFKKWIGVELTADNYKMLYVPEDFAHGFITLHDDTEVIYHVSQYYMPESEAGLRWNDPAFGIKWPVEVAVISEKDASWPDFKQI